ncbi:MAG TPA: lytic transglycosylase domain-containing protein, partial [Oligoflexia bacterium]|nr:lytic transglycosylase domain-containing protein [Oligoflexia bacterium]
MYRALKNGLILSSFFAVVFVLKPADQAAERAWLASLSDPKEALLAKQHSKRSKKAFGAKEVRRFLERQIKQASPEQLDSITQVILEVSKSYHFHPALILSLIRVESRFNAWAISPKGAIGLMQLMPETGRWLADRMGARWDGPAMLLDPEINIRFGTYYLAYLRERYNGDPKFYLSAYNVGPGRMDGWATTGY